MHSGPCVRSKRTATVTSPVKLKKQTKTNQHFQSNYSERMFGSHLSLRKLSWIPYWHTHSLAGSGSDQRGVVYSPQLPETESQRSAGRASWRNG